MGVAEAAQVVGVLLSTALLDRSGGERGLPDAPPGAAIALAAVLGVLETWLGIVLAYDSYTWPPGGKGWPVSFFITALALGIYLVARLLRPAARRRTRPAATHSTRARPEGSCRSRSSVKPAHLIRLREQGSGSQARRASVRASVPRADGGAPAQARW